jgi:large subunit ribosomal protein L23
MAQLENILIKPLLTEKTSIETEKFNKYAFVVDLKANKNQIKKAVENLFDVKVVNVATAVSPGKMKRYGRFTKKTNKTKKAYITVQKDQKIEFFKGI